jgi:hypothetical protein
MGENSNPPFDQTLSSLSASQSAGASSKIDFFSYSGGGRQSPQSWYSLRFTGNPAVLSACDSSPITLRQPGSIAMGEEPNRAVERKHRGTATEF